MSLCVIQLPYIDDFSSKLTTYSLMIMTQNKTLPNSIVSCYHNLTLEKEGTKVNAFL
jgi:hypothetical protein